VFSHNSQKIYNYTFKKAFLSDPSTYPLLVVLTGTAGLILGMSINAFTHYKDLRITPSIKHETVQSWGKEHKDSFVKKIVGDKKPFAWHAQGFKDLQHEGLGVDHEEWKKNKEAYLRK
jgi:hypothetical protein